MAVAPSKIFASSGSRFDGSRFPDWDRLYVGIRPQDAVGRVLMVGIAVAGTAGNEDDLRLTALFRGSRRRRQLLELNVAELHFHRRAGMKLEREDALETPQLRIVVRDVDHQLAVDELLEVVALGDDMIRVPIAVLDLFFNSAASPIVSTTCGLWSAPISTFWPRWATMPRPRSS